MRVLRESLAQLRGQRTARRDGVTTVAVKLSMRSENLQAYARSLGSRGLAEKLNRATNVLAAAENITLSEAVEMRKAELAQLETIREEVYALANEYVNRYRAQRRERRPATQADYERAADREKGK